MAYDEFYWNFVFCCVPHTLKIIEIPGILCFAICDKRETHQTKGEGVCGEELLLLLLCISYSAQTKTINRNWYANRPPLCATLCAYLLKKVKAKKNRSLTRAHPHTHTHTYAREYKGVSHIRILVACPCPPNLNQAGKPTCYSLLCLCWILQVIALLLDCPPSPCLPRPFKCIFNITTNAAPHCAAAVQKQWH